MSDKLGIDSQPSTDKTVLLSTESDLTSSAGEVVLPTEAERVEFVRQQDTYAQAAKMPEHTAAECQAKADMFAQAGDFRDAAELSVKYASKSAEMQAAINRIATAKAQEDELRQATAAKIAARKKKVYIILAIIVVVALAVWGAKTLLDQKGADEIERKGAEVLTPVQLDTLAVGDTVPFGSYNGKVIEWQVLDIEDVSSNTAGNSAPKRALLISKYVIELAQFDTIKGKDANNNQIEYGHWAVSDLRTWLNDYFYNRFTPSQQAQIVTPSAGYLSVSVDNADIALDHFWLLSTTQANRYFANDADRLAYLTPPVDYGIAPKPESVEWWLRTPGESKTGGIGRAMIVNGQGTIFTDGNSIINERGVRPAMWVSLETGK